MSANDLQASANISANSWLTNNKCEKHHSELFKNHHQFKLDKDFSDIFTGLCKEISHNDELQFFVRYIINYAMQNA